MEDFDSLNEKQLESLERGLSDLKHNRIITSNEFWKGLLSNKEQQLLIDEAYKNYLQHYADEYNEEQKKLQKNPLHWMVMEYTNFRPYTQEEFINKCKEDKEFSEKWRLTIEERELSYEERKKLCKLSDRVYPDNEWMKENNIKIQP
jgi:hypothetical protein